MEEEKRTSYFDVLKQSLSSKQSMTTSLTIAGTFTSTADRVEYTSHFQKLFRSLQSESNRITGILLVYKSTFLHIVEIPSQFVSTFLTEITKHQHTEHVNMVLFIDDAERMFPFWASRLLDQDTHQDQHQVSDELITLTTINLFKIGTSLSELQKSEMKTAFEELQDRYRPLVPSPSVVTALATTGNLFTVQDWMKEFTCMSIHLESERVWPVPRPLLIN